MTTTTHESPMALSDLILWVGDHIYTMVPEHNRTSEQFHVLVTELSGGIIPDYVLRGIDPASILSGDDGDTVYVRFVYRNGGTVTLSPDGQPTDADWMDYSEYLRSIHGQADYVNATPPGGLGVA